MPPGYLNGCLLRAPCSLGDHRLIVPIDCFVPAFLVGAKTRVGVADRRAMLLAVGRRGRAGRASQGRARRGEPRTWRRGRRLDKMSGRPHAARAIGMEGLHFHDLRHAGNHFAAASGAGLRDLMARMGHDSERAALIYQHQASGADRRITDAIDLHVQAERDENGAGGALIPAG
jgi:integrase